MRSDEGDGQLRFVPAEVGSKPELAGWIASELWPFHGTARPTREDVLRWAADGHFAPPDNRGFWIYERQADEPVGLVLLHELTDPTPIFDLRIRARARGRGLGRRVLPWLARYVFEEAGKHRIEGHTRVDNAPMRRVFRACGWVMEAYHRQAWPDGAGGYLDAVTYALLKDDWERGTSTPVEWER